ncbi:MAG: hypothetical protein RBR22_06405 [Desulfuromonas sp.]|nr:hypothetical protein [Desulfuromonas sp.]
MLSSRLSQHRVIIFTTLALFIFILTSVHVEAEKLTNSATAVNYQVVDLSADSTDNSDIIDVSGGIKNFGYTSIKGHAIIYLLDGNQSVLQAIDTQVNDGQSFRHAQTGKFETTVNIAGLSNVQSVTVEFIMDRI